MGAPSSAATVESLKKHVSELEAQNRHLTNLVQAAHSNTTVLCGYLYQYRSFSLGILTNEWELRYFTLSGTTVQYYKSEQDVVFTPRGVIDVQGCIVEWEGLKRGRFWTFGVLDIGGVSLLRLSTEKQATAEAWVQALENAGCARRSVVNQAIITANMRGKTTPKSPKSKVATEGAKVDDATTAAAKAQAGATAAAAAGGKPVSRAPMRGSTPVHVTSKYSILSSDGVWAASHQGLLNLCMVILITSNFRLIVENLLKYGLRLNVYRYVKKGLAGNSSNTPVVLSFGALAVFALISYLTERLGVQLLELEAKVRSGAAKKSDGDAKVVARQAALLSRVHEGALRAVTIANTTATLLLPCWVVSVTKASDPPPAFALVMCATVLWMKLVSYAHCNADLRAARRAGELRPGERLDNQGQDQDQTQGQVGVSVTVPGPRSVRYPENVTVWDLLYFLAAPTLVYQLNYPRTSRIRWRWVARRLLELAAWTGLLLFIADQYIEPSVANSLAPLRQQDWAVLLERVLKLALPSLYAWLCMFYVLFHLWLNLLAELLRFGDREFYRDWWNAATIGDYWKLWNMPVHRWLLRTVYFPTLRAGCSRTAAMMVVFFVSAIFHELVMGVPLHMVRFWAFAGIMGQVPLVIFTDWLRRKLKSDTWGNVIFWVSFCIVGQPVSLLMYYHDWALEHRPALLHSTANTTTL